MRQAQVASLLMVVIALVAIPILIMRARSRDGAPNEALADSA
jgi:hypothetical protein